MAEPAANEDLNQRVLDQRSKFSSGKYIYRYGGQGIQADQESGLIGVDCSHLVNLTLKDVGFLVPYQSTAEMNNSYCYNEIAFKDAKPGDIALWTRTRNHAGFLESIAFDPVSRKAEGTFFGSQTTTGPGSARYGGSNWWKMPDKILRVIEGLHRERRSATLPQLNVKVIGKASLSPTELTRVVINLDPLPDKAGFLTLKLRNSGEDAAQPQNSFSVVVDSNGHRLLKGFGRNGVQVQLAPCQSEVTVALRNTAPYKPNAASRAELEVSYGHGAAQSKRTLDLDFAGYPQVAQEMQQQRAAKTDHAPQPSAEPQAGP